MARKGENIRKRKDGRWEARYWKGRKPDGRIQYGYVYAPKYSEVKEKRDEAVKKLANDYNIKATASPVVFQNLFDEWEAIVRYTVKESSYCLYKTILGTHLSPYFGTLPVAGLEQKHIQTFIYEKMEAQLSVSYIHTMLLIFKSILKLAKHQKYLTDDLSVYHLPPIHKNQEIFSDKEWLTLQTYLRNQTDDFSFGLLICLHTGIRIGELSGLKWEDFDLVNNQITIARTVYRIKNLSYSAATDAPKTKLCIKPTKTKASQREIPLPDFLIKAVSDHRKSGENFVLTGNTHCMEPRNIQRRYKKILELCKLRYLNFHSLRHSFATIALQKGFDYKTLSEILGHASTSTTLNIYTHSNMEQKRRNMNLFSV